MDSPDTLKKSTSNKRFRCYSTCWFFFLNLKSQQREQGSYLSALSVKLDNPYGIRPENHFSEIWRSSVSIRCVTVIALSKANHCDLGDEKLGINNFKSLQSTPSRQFLNWDGMFPEPWISNDWAVCLTRNALEMVEIQRSDGDQPFWMNPRSLWTFQSVCMRGEVWESVRPLSPQQRSTMLDSISASNVWSRPRGCEPSVRLSRVHRKFCRQLITRHLVTVFQSHIHCHKERSCDP
jgi:hypothetical protein